MCTVLEYANVDVAHRLEPMGGAQGQRVAAAVVHEHDLNCRIGEQPTGFKLEPAVGQVHRMKRMPFAILPLLAHIQQGQFPRVGELLFQGARLDVVDCTGWRPQAHAATSARASTQANPKPGRRSHAADILPEEAYRTVLTPAC